MSVSLHDVVTPVVSEDNPPLNGMTVDFEADLPRNTEEARLWRGLASQQDSSLDDRIRDGHTQRTESIEDKVKSLCRDMPRGEEAFLP